MPIAARCSPRYAEWACKSRHNAQRVGEFMFYMDTYQSGWVLAEDRHPLWAARDGRLYTWTFCPYCGNTLPDAADMLFRAMMEDDDDGGA